MKPFRRCPYVTPDSRPSDTRQTNPNHPADIRRVAPALSDIILYYNLLFLRVLIGNSVPEQTN